MIISPIPLCDQGTPGPASSNHVKSEGRHYGFESEEPGVKRVSFSACKNESDSDSQYSYSQQLKEVHNEPITHSQQKKSVPVNREASIRCKSEKSGDYKGVRYLPQNNTLLKTNGQRPQGPENFLDSLRYGSIDEIYFRVEHIGYEKLRAILPAEKLKVFAQKFNLKQENNTINRLLCSLLITVSLYTEKELTKHSATISSFLDMVVEHRQYNTSQESLSDLRNACVTESNKIYKELIGDNFDRYEKKAFHLFEELVITPLKEQLGNKKMEDNKIRERAIKSFKKAKEFELQTHENEKLLASADLVKYVYCTSRNFYNIVKGNP